MSRDHRAATKRIPKSIGTETKLLGSYTLADAIVGLAPGVVVLLVTQVLLPAGLTVGGLPVQRLALPLATVAIGLGALFVYLTPAYTTSVAWVATVLGFHASDHELDHEAAKAYTRIERIHPARNALERTDGALLGVLEVDPPTMALATDAEWAAKAEGFEEFCNTAVEFPIQIYSTTHEFPIEDYLEHYRARLEDPDVQANPQLERLIESYVDWYAEALDARRMTIREHYVIVPVRPEEIRFEPDSFAGQLGELPLVGWLLGRWSGPSQAAQRTALFDALDERVRQVRTGLGAIDGCAASRVEGRRAARLVGAFWAGEGREYHAAERALRTNPIVTPAT
ncbi:MAG: hypothetical protein ABEH59_12360 [Halobacteriales archaeon]